MTKKWSKMIIERWKDMFQYFADKPPIEVMSRVMLQFQSLRVFGGHYWVGEQTLTLPEDKQSMLRIPPEHLLVNSKDPEGRYWVSVSIEGVSLVSVERNSTFQRKFLYADDAVERLLR